MSETEIARLREEIAGVDKEIVALVARRLLLAELVGMEKKLSEVAIRDAEVEGEVALRVHRECATRGISEAFAEGLSGLLIEESVRRQESLRAPKPLHTRVLVVGGAGQMGRWLSRYLRSRGHEVLVNDVAGPLEDFAFEPDLAKGAAEADAIAVSVPMTVAPQVLERIDSLRPKGLVFDLCSLKAPVVAQLRTMARSGLKVASVHPMFGPDLFPLSSGNILFSDCGDGVAVLEAKELFRASGAVSIDVSLDHHDEFMAYLLGLSHLTLLTFARAVARNPFDLAGLRHPAGTTFSRLSVAARGLLEDSPELLRDIQALNPHTPSVHHHIREALDDWQRATADSDGKEFRRLLEHARSYFGDAPP